MPDEVEVTIVTMALDAVAERAERLLAVLAKYVVLTRQQPGCRNVDLTHSVTTPGRFVVISKWESPAAQRAHFDSQEMIEFAQACDGLLTAKPDIDLLEGLSAYDLE